MSSEGELGVPIGMARTPPLLEAKGPESNQESFFSGFVLDVLQDLNKKALLVLERPQRYTELFLLPFLHIA